MSQFALQTRQHDDAPWRIVHSFQSINADQVEVVRRHRGQARLWDRTYDVVVAESLPVQGVPFSEDALQLFG